MHSDCRVKDNNVYCCFPAELTHVENVVDTLKSIPLLAKRKKIFFDVSLVLREALNNAIIHGADRDLALNVECTVNLDSQGIHIVVSGPGSGFDWEKCLSQDFSDCPAQSGWGIYLIREYTDHLSFTDGGKKLECWLDPDRYQEPGN